MQKAAQGCGGKSCAGLWWKKLRKVLVQKATKGFGVKRCKGFGVKRCAGFRCQNLCKVLLEKKTVQCFSVKRFEKFWYKKMRRVLV